MAKKEIFNNLFYIDTEGNKIFIKLEENIIKVHKNSQETILIFNDDNDYLQSIFNTILNKVLQDNLQIKL